MWTRLGQQFYFTLCVVDGGWTDWTAWSSCLHTCGRHSRSHRTRTCSNPAPLYGGHPCPGLHLDSKACNIGPCPGKKKIRSQCIVLFLNLLYFFMKSQGML